MIEPRLVEEADVPLAPSQPSNASGIPQRGNMRVKICVRAEWRPLTTPSTNGELAESASSSGRKLRSALQTAIARSAPRIADVDVEPEGVVAPDDVAEDLVVAAVVRRVDDPLVLPAAPRMRAGRAELEPEVVGELGELRAALAHRFGGLGEGLAAAGPDLDLRGDQLADEMRLELGDPAPRPGAPRSG